MDKETIKEKINLSKIEEVIFEPLGIEHKLDYIIDTEGNAIIPVSPLEFKIIEKIKELEARIVLLEEKLKKVV